MLLGDGLFGLALLALWLYAIFDVIGTDSSLCRNLPKGVWLILVIILPDIGAICWLLMGRPVNAGFRPGDPNYRAPRRPIALEDSPRFSQAPTDPDRSAELDRRLDEWEADQRKKDLELRARELEIREAELRRREQALGTEGGSDAEAGGQSPTD